MTIPKKVWSPYFQYILNGKKKLELRLADFEVHEGDILLLKEWDPETKEYTGREIEKKVTYVIKTKDCKFWSQEDVDKYGLQVIQFD